MKKCYYLLFGLLVCLTGCQDHKANTTAAKVATVEKQLEPFNRVTVKSGTAAVYLKQADVESLKIEAEESIISAFDVRVENKTLEIEQKINTNLSPTKPINFYVTTRNIDSIAIYGSGDLYSQGNLKVERLKVNISGSGKADLDVTGREFFLKVLGSGEVRVKGNVESQKIAINGDANYNAANLLSKEAYISMNGSGKASIDVQDTLVVKIFGAGILKYKGSPEIRQNISGSGSIEPISAK